MTPGPGTSEQVTPLKPTMKTTLNWKKFSSALKNQNKTPTTQEGQRLFPDGAPPPPRSRSGCPREARLGDEVTHAALATLHPFCAEATRPSTFPRQEMEHLQRRRWCSGELTWLSGWCPAMLAVGSDVPAQGQLRTVPVACQPAPKRR